MKQGQCHSTYFTWTTASDRSVSVFIFVLVVFVCIVNDRASACYARPYFNKRTVLFNTAFIKDEVRPNVMESDKAASGPLYFSNIVTNGSSLHKLNLNLPSLRNVEVSSKNALLMTKTLRDCTVDLAVNVQRHWKGKVKLRIYKSWIPPASFYNPRLGKKIIHFEDPYTIQAARNREEAYHMAGRAIDFTIIRPPNPDDNMNLGVLAQLAFYNAKFSWCRYRQENYIHCSVRDEYANSGKTLSCFPGESTVILKSGQRRPLSDLRVGDEILAVDANSGKPIFSRVRMFLHKERKTTAHYLRLTTSDNRTISLSANHLVYRLRSSFSSSRNPYTATEAVYAKNVLVGHELLMAAESKADFFSLRPTTVVDIQFVRKLGVYAPLTESGNVIIDDHFASCFAHVFSERLAKWALYPLQIFLDIFEIWSSLFDSSVTMKNANPLIDENAEGVHWYVRLLHTVANIVLPSSWLFTS